MLCRSHTTDEEHLWLQTVDRHLKEIASDKNHVTLQEFTDVFQVKVGAADTTGITPQILSWHNRSQHGIQLSRFQIQTYELIHVKLHFFAGIPCRTIL